MASDEGREVHLGFSTTKLEEEKAETSGGGGGYNTRASRAARRGGNLKRGTNKLLEKNKNGNGSSKADPGYNTTTPQFE